MAERTIDGADGVGRPRADLLSWGIVGMLGIVWGGSFSFTSVAVEELPPITVAASRLLIGALVLAPIALSWAGGVPSPRGPAGRRIWLFALAAAIFSNVGPFTLLAWAQQDHVESGLAAIFMSATPLIVLPLAAWLVAGERMTAAKTIGFAIGCVGVALLVGTEALRGLGGGWIEILAQLACLAAATGYAIGSVVLKRAPSAHPIAFSALVLAMAAAIATPVAFIVEDPFAASWGGASLIAVLYLGILPTAIAMMLLFVVIRRAGPTFFSLVNYQVPVWGMVFGVVFLGEEAPEEAALALLVILAGVAISQGVLDRIAKTFRARGGQT